MLACTGLSAVSPCACTARMNVVEVTPAWENTFLTLQPTLVVEDWAKARPLMAEFLDKTRTQRGAMYSGWTVCGDKLFCREAFAESAFLLEHLREVRPSLDALLAPGTTRLLEMQLHGPADELSKCAAAMDGLDTQAFEIVSGFTTLVRPYGGMLRAQAFSSLQPSFTVADGTRRRRCSSDASRWCVRRKAAYFTGGRGAAIGWCAGRRMRAPTGCSRTSATARCSGPSPSCAMAPQTSTGCSYTARCRRSRRAP